MNLVQLCEITRSSRDMSSTTFILLVLTNAALGELLTAGAGFREA